MNKRLQFWNLKGSISEQKSYAWLLTVAHKPNWPRHYLPGLVLEIRLVDRQKFRKRPKTEITLTWSEQIMNQIWGDLPIWMILIVWPSKLEFQKWLPQESTKDLLLPKVTQGLKINGMHHTNQSIKATLHQLETASTAHYLKKLTTVLTTPNDPLEKSKRGKWTFK